MYSNSGSHSNNPLESYFELLLMTNSTCNFQYRQYIHISVYISYNFSVRCAMLFLASEVGTTMKCSVARRAFGASSPFRDQREILRSVIVPPTIRNRW